MASTVHGTVPLSPDDGGVKVLQHHQLPEEIKCVAFSPAGGSIATGGTTGRVRVFSAHDFELIWDFEHHRDSVWGLDFSPQGSVLASASWDGTICLWETATGDKKSVLVGHEGKVCTVKFSVTGDWLVTGGMDESVRIWATNTGELIDFFTQGLVHPVLTVAISPSGSLLAEASIDTTVRLWDLNTEGTRTHRVLSRIRENAKRQEEEAYERRDSQRGRRDSRRKIKNLKMSYFGQESADSPPKAEPQARPETPMGDCVSKFTLHGHTAAVSDLAFHPSEDNLLVSASHDGSARLWDLQDNQGILLTKISSSSGSAVWNCRFSTDGSMLALGTGVGVIELIDHKSVPDPLLLLSFDAHDGYVHSCAFSNDGLRLATGGSDNQVKLWKLKPADWMRDQISKRRKNSARRKRQGRRPSESAQSDDASAPTSPQVMPDTASDGAASHVSAFDPYTWRVHGENNRLHAMLEDRRQEVSTEEGIVRALELAVLERQADVDRLAAQRIHDVSKTERRAQLHLPNWGLAAGDAGYVDKLRARREALYARVGRVEPKGDTHTYMGVAALQPSDPHRHAAFEQRLQHPAL
eukprot:m.1313061 g.1313061  ORF g.1313061 m.1313061 type:complete len:581 (-) comp24832_c0_seq3:3810-5552(-)